MALDSVAAGCWINGLLKEHERFRQKCEVTPEQQLEFLQQQYEQLFLLHRAVAGQVVFVGAPPFGEGYYV